MIDLANEKFTSIADLAVEATPGADIGSACKEAVRLAEATGLAVRVDFNGRVFRVGPTHADTAMELWEAKKI